MADPLKQGSKGADVLAWQTFLLQRKLFNGTPEGTYGGFTAKATSAFQKQEKLPETGIVDEATLKSARKYGFELPSLKSVTKPPAKAIPPALTKKDVDDVAQLLGVSSAAVRAVCLVESSGGGFLPDGRVKIRFEGHIFWKELVRRSIAPEPIALKNPTLCFKEYTRQFYRDPAGEWERLLSARAINLDAANASASWGMFQIMGFNFQQSGYASVGEYIADMVRGERQQLIAFSKFIKAQGLIDFMKNQNWLEFAKKYNGPRYIENKYDTKLATFYTKAIEEGYKA
jgi:hypothetical protein